MPLLSQTLVQRALDRDAKPVHGARLSIFESGTTTPVTAYKDRDMTDPHPLEIIAQDGVWPEMYLAAGSYRFLAQDTEGFDLPGYPVDNVDVATGEETTVTVTGGGLATGGGVITTNQVISVNAASQSEAEAGTSTTTVMTPQRSRQAFEYYALGFGQTWQDMSGSRAVETSYQNTTLRPIVVNVTASDEASSASLQLKMQVSEDNAAWVDVGYLQNNPSGQFRVSNLSIIIPPGNYYRMTGTDELITSWAELR